MLSTQRSLLLGKTLPRDLGRHPTIVSQQGLPAPYPVSTDLDSQTLTHKNFTAEQPLETT